MPPFELYASTSPFKAPARVEVPEGASIHDMLFGYAGLREEDAEHVVVYVGEHLIERRNWRKVRPKRGAHVYVKAHDAVLGGGGGKSPLRIILTLALVAATFFFAGPLGGFLLPGAAAATQSAVGGLLISTVGGLLINAIAPIRPPDLGNLSGQLNQSPSLFLDGSQNSLRPFEPVPDVLGFFRFRLPLAAPTFTEALGDVNILRMLLTAGYGRVLIEDLRIGETPLENFDNFNLEIRQGRSTDEPVTLYPNSVFQEAFSVVLKEPDGFTTRTTGPDTDEISVDLVFPKGLVRIGKLNDLRPARVTVQIQWRPVGGTFIDLEESISRFTFEPNNSIESTSGQAAGGTFVADGIQFFHQRAVAIRHGIRWKTGSRGQFEVRIRRVTPDQPEGSKISDETVWTLLQSFTDENPVNFPVPLSFVALEIQSTDQINGAVQTLSALVKRVALDWDAASQTWIFRETNNPASLFRYVLQSPANARRVGNLQIDLEALQTWHEFCEARGFTYNRVHDFESSVQETLFSIAAAGRARPTFNDGLWSVIIDVRRNFAVQHFTPRNSRNFSLEKAFPRLPDAFRVRFVNEDNGFRQDERLVPLAGKTLEGATLFERLELPGVTRPQNVWRLARHHAAVLESRPEQWTFTADFEHLVARVGDRVKITHDVLDVGITSGRITAVTLNLGMDMIVGFTIDEQVVLSAGVQYGITIRTDGDLSNRSQTYQVTGSTDPGGTRELTLVQAISLTNAPAVGDLYGFGLLGIITEEGQILGIEPGEDFAATITAAPYRDATFNISDDEPIPLFTPIINPPVELPAVEVTNITNDESVLEVFNNTTLVRCVFEVRPIATTQGGAFLEVQQRTPGSNEAFRNSTIVNQGENFVVIGDVNTDQFISFRLRWNTTSALVPGPWTVEPGIRIIGKATPPSGLLNPRALPLDGSVTIAWDAPVDELDVLYGGFVEFRFAENTDGTVEDTWERSRGYGQQVQARALNATLPLKPGTLYARVTDEIGRQSTITEIPMEPTSEFVNSGAGTASIFQNPSFSGTKTNTIVGPILGSPTNVLSLGPPADNEWDDIVDFDAVENIDGFSIRAKDGTYNFTGNVDQGSVVPIRLTTVVRGLIGDDQPNIDDRFEDIDDWIDWDGGPEGEAATDYWVEERHTNLDPNVATENDFSPWQKLEQADFEARGFQFRARLTTRDFRYNPAIRVLGVRSRLLTNIRVDGNVTAGGAGTFNDLSVANDAFAGTFTATNELAGNRLDINAGSPRLRLNRSGDAFDQKRWDVNAASGGTYALQTVNDAELPIQNAYLARRTASQVVDQQFNVNNVRKVLINSEGLVLDASSDLRLLDGYIRTVEFTLASGGGSISLDFPARASGNIFGGLMLVTTNVSGSSFNSRVVDASVIVSVRLATNPRAQFVPFNGDYQNWALQTNQNYVGGAAGVAGDYNISANTGGVVQFKNNTTVGLATRVVLIGS